MEQAKCQGGSVGREKVFLKEEQDWRIPPDYPHKGLPALHPSKIAEMLRIPEDMIGGYIAALAKLSWSLGWLLPEGEDETTRILTSEAWNILKIAHRMHELYHWDPHICVIEAFRLWHLMAALEVLPLFEEEGGEEKLPDIQATRMTSAQAATMLGVSHRSVARWLSLLDRELSKRGRPIERVPANNGYIVTPDVFHMLVVVRDELRAGNLLRSAVKKAVEAPKPSAVPSQPKPQKQPWWRMLLPA